jgi:hypothetical protein
MSGVAILCPSRDRPRDVADLLKGVIQTAPETTLLVYIDRDQRELYQWCFHEGAPQQLKVTVGERVGPCAAANYLLRQHPEFDAYGMFCDDCRVTVPGWDRFVLDTLNDDFAMVAPAHACKAVDFPFVSKKWTETLGWYCHPSLYHWGWDAVLASLGVAADTMIQAEPHEFWFDHDVVVSMNRDRYPRDVIRLYEYFCNHFPHDVRRLREAP